MLKERFLKYVQVYTISSEESTTSPSTHRQFNPAHIPRDELLDLGLEDVKVSDHYIVTGSLPGFSKESLGLIAHMDTSPGFPGQGVEPRVIGNYDKGPIHLKGADLAMDPKDFLDLKDLVGKTVVTSDGTTPLGADDKAGVAATMEVLAYHVAHPDIPCPILKVAFTPDEEVGRGTENLDVQDLACDYASIVDGGDLGEPSIENFDAASATVTIQGLNIHPGSAKDKVVNALNVVTDLHRALPVAQRPQHIKGREGLIHFHTSSGSIEEAQLNYIIRNPDPDLFQEEKDLIQKLGDLMAEKYHTQIQVEIKDSYHNMEEELDKVDFLTREVLKAIKENSVSVRLGPIRGGTDGAMLSRMGLPCPNLLTGDHHFHGRYRCIALEDLQKARDVLISLVAFLGQRK